MGEPFEVGLSRLVLGHARIRELDVAYLECPTRRGHLHWYVAVGDAGIRFAQPLSHGRLIRDADETHAGSESEPSVERIETHLHDMFPPHLATRDDRIVAAFREGIWDDDTPEPLGAALAKWGVRIAQGDADAARARIEAAIAPLRDRLGERMALLRDYRMARETPTVPFERPWLSNDRGKARLLRLDAAEVEGLVGLGRHHPLLREIVDLDGVSLAAPPAGILSGLMRELGVPAAAARRKRAGPHLNRHDVMAMRTLPIDWLPKPDDHEGWRALGFVCVTFDEAGVPEGRWLALTASSKGDWPAFMRRCRRAAYGDEGDEARLRQVSLALRSASDVVGGFNAFLTAAFRDDPVAWRRTYRTAEEAVVGDRSLPSILENSRLWHERFKAPSPGGLEWEAILPRWTDPATGIEVVPLTGSDELIEEGDVMGHCVGGEAFSLGCVRNEIRILSLRRDGERMSTAEIDLGDGTESSQHLGSGNGEPPEDAHGCLRRYLNLPAYKKARRAVVAVDDHLPERTGSEFEVLLERWRPYLTGRWKRATLEDFLGVLRKDGKAREIA